jgi:hypothetical protein
MAAVNTKEILFFAKLLSTSTRQTRLAILKNIVSWQCELLRQIFYNIVLNSSIDLSSSEKDYMKKRLTTVKLLASKKVCKKKKSEIFVKNQSLVLKACKIVVKYLS